VVVALAGIDDALEALKGGGIGGEGVAASTFQGDFDIFYYKGIVGAIPEVGLDTAHAAEAPFVVNESIYELDAMGIGTAVVLVIFCGELGEVLGFFVEHDLVDGVNAVLQGVEAGYGLACGGARAGIFLCIQAIRCGLLIGCHKNLDLRLAGAFGAGGR